MDGKIGLEEHFAIPETLNDSLGFLPKDHWPELKSRILDSHDRMLREMDANGVQMMLLSLNAPAIQAIPEIRRADEIARRANDFLANEVARRPDRFQGLAALPMQDPDLASREMERCVRDLGFRGALVNGFSQRADESSVIYYDAKEYWPFWSEVERLDVPFYLHPRSPLPAMAPNYSGHPWLAGASWGFGHETAVHALRLMGSGLFDAYPKLAIVLGHLGEGLPYSLWRIDSAAGWVKSPPKYPAKKKIRDYFLSNFHLTTSGNFRTQSLIDAILEVGADRIMFAIDWPFENIDHAAAWFHFASISEHDRLKIGRLNAVRLFKLEV